MLVPPTHTHGRTYEGEALRAVAMPLGGIGTGTIALCGDGSLRQWQIHNQVNHLACVPHSFFAIHAREDRPTTKLAITRVLQSDALYGTPEPEVPPVANDHIVPIPHRRLLSKFPGMESTIFTGTYPIAEIAYHDIELPLQVTLEAFNPFIPLDADASGIPVVCFNFTITNPTAAPWRVSLAGMLQNAVGWDGIAPISDTRCALYGGNANTLVRTNAGTSIQMGNAWLPNDAEGNGTMALSVDAPDVTWLTQWDDLRELWDDFSADGRFTSTNDSTPSAQGRTWSGALAAHHVIAPGESVTIPYRLAWHFPNRYVNWNQQLFLHFHDTKSKLFIGNHYATRFNSALDVIDHMATHCDQLTAATRLSAETLHDSTLPQSLMESVIAPISVLRSPTCFWTEDGAFYGFEGCNGASTAHHAATTGGSCPLNCTHVWNYEMTLSRLFPALERSMRDTEWKIQQRPDGSLPHRVLLPTYLPRNNHGIIGAPDNPALDGLFGAILKTYREYLASGDRDWLASVWPGVTRALDYVWTALDPDRTGVIEGEQPNTYDISIYGANTFIGTLYLAALRATAHMATVMNQVDFASTCETIAGRGSEALDARLWNGSYYVQDVDLAAHPEQNWASGCHIDQLFGQWWAWALGLGDLLDPDHLRIATKTIFETNFRTDFRDRNRNVREYVTDTDRGTIICTWPNGGRPDVPTLYSDEVWSGLEYELAGLLLFAGHNDAAITVLDAVRDRMDGTKQSPWNDIECGDHYVRSMSSWPLLEAATGMRYDAASGSLAFAPRITPDTFRAPFVTRDGWGTFEQDAEHAILTIHHGSLTLASITLDREIISIAHGLEFLDLDAGDDTTVRFPGTITLRAGETLTING